MEIILDYVGEHKIITSILISKREGARESNRMCYWKQRSEGISNWLEGVLQQRNVPVEAREDKETDSPP